MAVTKVYGLFLKSLATKQINLETDTFKMMLCSSGYTPNQDTHQYKNQVTSEVTGTGYTAGGATVVPTFTKDTTNHRLTIVFPQLTWTGSTITARKAVCYKSTGTASTSPRSCAIEMM